MKRPIVWWTCTLLISLVFGAPGAIAQSFPSRPISLIVSSPPGAGVDFFARMLAEKLAARLAQSVIVENRAGASGMIAAAHTVKAAADGHTLLLMPNTLVIAPHVLSTQARTVNVLTELTPIVMPVATLMVLAVNGKTASNDLAALIAAVKRAPGQAYTGGARGSPMHILGEQLKRDAGIELQHVPYKGVAPAVAAAISGEVEIIWMPSSGHMQYFKSGSLRALAIASPKRSALLPNVPTMIELGYRDIEAVAWFGLLAPLGTPPAIVARLNQEVNAVLSADDIRERLSVAGYVPGGGSPADLAAQMRADDARYRKLAVELKVREE